MYKTRIQPRFYDTDCLGHINNAAFISWMEEARRPVFLLFNPTLSVHKWNLILAKVQIDYLAQCYYGIDVVVETSLEKIGTSSFTLFHRFIQNQTKVNEESQVSFKRRDLSILEDKTKVAEGKSVAVYFDYKKKKAMPISKDVRKRLTDLCLPEDD